MAQNKNEELGKRASESILGPNPVIGAPTRDIISTARQVMRQTIKQPVHSLKHVGRLSMAVTRVMIGRSEIVPAPEDKRFLDPTWSQNPLYRRYMQSYLAWRTELNDWITSSNLPEQDVSRAQFVISLLTEAMAPTNTALNPAAAPWSVSPRSSRCVNALPEHGAAATVDHAGSVRSCRCPWPPP